jgi:acetylglutamate kinase
MSGPLTLKLGGTAGLHAKALGVVVAAAEQGWVIVHGGGGEVADWSRRLGLEPRSVDGRRVTDPETLEVVVAVLRGLVNARLVARLNAAGRRAVGLSGVDGPLFSVRPLGNGMGAVALVDKVDDRLLDRFVDDGLVPVVAPVGADAEGRLYNINADEVAGAIAAARGGRLLLLTDVPAVLRHGVPVRHLEISDAESMLTDGTADGGMRPKLRAAIAAARAGCDVRIVNGTSATEVAAALAGEDAGTTVTAAAQPATQPLKEAR